MNYKNIYKNNRGQVGIGTLIIFIAMVLVAAIAAAVLLQTAGVLQQRAHATGMEATAEVTGGLAIMDIIGERVPDTANHFDWVNITVRTTAGAGSIDLGKAVVTIANRTARAMNLRHNATISGGNFIITEIRDEDESFSLESPVINAGDLVTINIRVRTGNVSLNPVSTNITFEEREPFKIEIIPEFGNTAFREGTTPFSFGVNKFIAL